MDVCACVNVCVGRCLSTGVSIDLLLVENRCSCRCMTDDDKVNTIFIYLHIMEVCECEVSKM